MCSSDLFRPSDFVALFADPRLLVVRVTARRLQCTVVVAHAPHSGEDHAARDAWWSRLVDRVSGLADVVLLVDANARLGSALSDSVGPGGFRQDEDEGGALFHRALTELSLFVPASFDPPDASAFTWTSVCGRRHRIDYVAVPAAWRASVLPGSSGVVAVDAAAGWEDHALATLVARLSVKLAPRRVS